jgi:2-polyprenyl-6-methoxyphenol hydroxylase-like FAD-dependent oxidoreductase
LEHHLATRALVRAGRPARVLVLDGRPLPGEGADLGDRAAVAGSSLARQQVIGVKVLEELKDEIGFELPAKYFLPHSDVPIVAEPPAGATARMHAALGSASPATIPINEFQALLIEHGRKMGIQFEFGTKYETELVAVRQGKKTILVRDRSGQQRALRTQWLVGADGAGSRVRAAAGIAVKEGDKQGHMVGCWFKGLTPCQRINYDLVEPGGSGTLLSSGEHTYTLNPLPKELAHLARKPRDKLTEAERATLDRHLAAVAREKLVHPEDRDRVRVHVHDPFHIQLNQAETAVLDNTLLVGDAVQTVNPLTGSGANLAMLQGLEAGRAAAIATANPLLRSRVLNEYRNFAKEGADYIHARSREYAGIFGERAAPSLVANGRPLTEEQVVDDIRNAAKRPHPEISMTQWAKILAQRIVDDRGIALEGKAKNDQYFTMTTKPAEDALRGVNLNGKTVLDFGAGTGVITTISQMHGPRQILAWEMDKAALAGIEATTNPRITTVIPAGFDFKGTGDWADAIRRAGGPQNVAVISNPPYFAIPDIKAAIDREGIQNVLLYIPKRLIGLFPREEGWHIVGELGAGDFYPTASTTLRNGQQLSEKNHLVVARGLLARNVTN